MIFHRTQKLLIMILYVSEINLRRDKNRSTPGSGSRTPQVLYIININKLHYRL